MADEVITVRTADGVAQMSLPQVYAALSTDAVEDFVYLRPHQRHPLHSTLCQIGAIALVHAGLTEVPTEINQWRDLLESLTRDEFPEQEPWHLVVPDYDKPAFLQPPTAYDKAKIICAPDEMDLTVGSKRHDVKDGRIRHATADYWLYALIACQTASGFGGAKLYGISRMNSGFGNRHGFSMTPNTRWGVHIVRDIERLAQLCNGQPVQHLLLWTKRWDGALSESLTLDDLCPNDLYVEICRRVRLVSDTEGITHAIRVGSNAPRVYAKESKGRTNDPWMLTDVKKEQAVTVSSNGFGFREISKYIDPQQYELPKLAGISPDDGSAATLVARSMVLGQGGTEGYYEQEIGLRSSTTKMLRKPSGQNELAQAAKIRVDLVAEVASILRHAVKTYLQGGDSAGKTKKEHESIINNYSKQLQSAVEPTFWDRLQDELDSADPLATQIAWINEDVVPAADRILKSAHGTGRCRYQDRFRAIAESSSLFQRRIRASNKLPKKETGEE